MSPTADLMTTLAWSLLHFFWQGAAIAALAAVAMALFRESSTRYLIGIFALALMCMSFGATFAFLIGAPAAGTEIAADAALVRANDVPALLSSALERPSIERSAAADRDLAWLARGWLGVVCLLALRVAYGLLLLERLRRRNLTALPLEIVERCRALQHRLGISRIVRYCECRLVTVPSVIGFFRPIVLLPVQALTGLSAEQLDVVIAHELGHIKRFDVVVNFLQVVVETLFFFHPAVWWLNRRIRADRENCCDDVAIAACGRKLDYARALALMEDWRGPLQLSMAATGGDVTSRVARLLGMSRQPSGARSAGVFTAVLVLAAALMAGVASIGFSQIVAQVESPVIERVEWPVVTQAKTPVTAQAGWPVTAQVEGPLFAQARPSRRARDDAEDTGDEPRAPAHAPRGPSFIDDMKSVGFDVTDVDLLVALKIHNVTADYVHRIRDTGLDPDTEEVIALKIHGVGPEYIAQLHALGFDAGFDDVLAMKIRGVTPGYVEQLRALGLDSGFDDVLAMKIHGVTPEYVERMRATVGFELDLDDVMALKIHGVTPEFINEARSRGFDDLSLDQIIQLKNAGVL
jgi:beta-lactamase regulating signal transducer with metallopeptidase domain